ncbi:ewing's tumor-associated antigen 1 isoform X2 [Sceloporus undulatus]|uniref:ewing's tumor-associated antigen 1 isoform X2 n=1 Tax=Sceloporus undulatus TaxID=8520 RepID=UPI001C4CCDE5|nr:ewing's tumor-associated antigen 1 isoform X2 [Sceloporus undulatus]
MKSPPVVKEIFLGFGLVMMQFLVLLQLQKGHQLKHREEELLKLAKQFDKNLTDAIQDQDASCHNITHITLETGRSTEHEDETGEEKKHQSLEEYPKVNTTLPFVAVDVSTKALEPCEDSRQEPLDLDAEIALHELFDCSTQKCSGRLSQGLSDCSSNSSIHENQSTLLEDALAVDNITAANKCEIGEAPVREDSAAPVIECMAPAPTQKAKEVSEQTAPKIGSCKIGSVVSSKVDQVVNEDFDDWGDDSFLMQITHNPELISTPENALPLASDKNGERKEKTVISDHGALFNSFKNDPTSSALQKQSIATGNTMTILPHNNITIKAEKIKSISVSGHPKISCSNPIPVKPEDKSRQEGFTQLKCPASNHFPEKRAAALPNHSDLPKPQMGKYGSSMSNMGLWRELPKNNVLSFDDWNEPKFSKDVLDLCSESDSLWGTRGEEDDDLLYQVCDDVEKNTVSHDVVKENEKSKSTLGCPSKLEVGPCLAVANQGISNCPQTRKSHVGRRTFSLDAPVTLAALLKSDTSTDPAQHNWRPFKTESISHIPEKWCRSHSVPGGDFGSGSASAPLSGDCLNDSHVQWQNGLRNMGKVPNKSSINQLPTEKSKYVFKKTNHVQALVLDNKSVNIGNHSGIVLGLGENKNGPNIPFQTAIQTNTKPPFKRHLSDCFAQYETEQKGRKCSQEEIARKKQEALERRKCKMQALLKNTAPT